MLRSALFLSTLLFAQVSGIDEICPAIVSTALESTQMQCEQTTLNEICYGNDVLNANPQPGTGMITFEQPGDIEEVFRLQSLRLSPMTFDSEIWGVALMRVQAALQTGGAEDVLLVLFGDVLVDSASYQAPVTATEGVNVRALPIGNSRIIGSLSAGQSATAIGRSTDSQWLQVRVPPDEMSLGWVAAGFVRGLPQVDEVPVTDQVEGPGVLDEVYAPMQAFYFESARADAPCAEAPNSGLLIQTPEGTAEVNMLVNEVDIRLNATAFLQAVPGEDMAINVLEGEATVEVNGVSHTLVAGTSLSVPISEDRTPSGLPTGPVPFDANDVQALPVPLLDRPVEIPEPLEMPPGVPVEGEWRFSWGSQTVICPNGTNVDFVTEQPTTNVEVVDNGAALILLGSRFNQVDVGAYRAIFADSSGSLHNYALDVSSIDRMAGTAAIDYVTESCQITVPFQMDLVRRFDS